MLHFVEGKVKAVNAKVSIGAMSKSIGHSGFSGNETYTFEKPKGAIREVKKSIDIKHFNQRNNSAA